MLPKHAPYRSTFPGPDPYVSAMPSEERQWRLQDFLCSAAIKTLLTRGKGDYRTLPCSVSEQLKTRAERHGRLKDLNWGCGFASA